MGIVSSERQAPFSFSISTPLPAAFAIFLCTPIVTLAVSPAPILMWIGRAAILAVFALSFVVGTWGRLSFLIMSLAAALLLIGAAHINLDSSQWVVQCAQIMIFATIVAKMRHLNMTPYLRAATLAVVGAVALLNIAFPVAPLADDTHDFTQAVGVFGNPNSLATFWVIILLTIITTIRGTRRQWPYYLAVLAVAYFIAEASSRAVVLTVIAYFTCLFTFRMTRGSKLFLSLAAIGVMLATPIIVGSLPFLYKVELHFTPPDDMPIAVAPILPAGKMGEIIKEEIEQRSDCIPTALQKCDTPKQESQIDLPKAADGGAFGVEKQFSTGRDTIWPAVVALSGVHPFFGHGLGSLPGELMKWPYHGRSAHNGFIQIYFQYGAVGLLLYLAIFIALFVRAISIQDYKERASSTAILCAIVVIETFNVVLVQNNFGFGVALAILLSTNVKRTPHPI